MSISPDNLLLQTKQDLYHRLLGDPFLAEVSVLIDDEHDLQNRDKVNLGPKNMRGGKTGACVTVLAVAVLGLDSGETPSPLMKLVAVFEVLEDVLINAGADGSQINAAEITARLIQLCHQMHFDDRFTGFRLASDGAIVEIEGDIAGRRGYAVKFEASDASFDTVANVAPVVITEDTGEITLACTTASAAIYYTTDGSYPGIGNDQATLYTAPFTPTVGALVRAAAEKADMNPSKIVLSHLVTG